MSNYKILNWLILAGVIAGISLAITFLTSNRYKLDLESSNDVNNKANTSYYDLDGDGDSEKIRVNEYADNHVGVIVYMDGKVLDEWTIQGSYAPLFRNDILDINDDGLAEIIVFSYKDDSIYLNCLDPLNGEFRIKNKFVSEVQVVDEALFTNPTMIGLYDLNRDGTEELYFSLNTGFLKTPRKIYCYDHVNDSLYSSATSGVPIYSPRFVDLDLDGIPEIIADNGALDNFDEEYPYSDHYAWLIVWDAELKFKFEPGIIGAFPSRSKMIPLLYTDTPAILVAHNSNNEDKDYLAVYSNHGDLIKQKEQFLAETEQTIELLDLSERNNDPIIILNEGDVYQVNEDLELEFLRNIGFVFQRSMFFKTDINMDGKEEYVTYDQARKTIRIFSEYMQSYVDIAIARKFKSFKVNLISGKDEESNLFIDAGNALYYLSYEKSLIYQYWYLIVILELILAVLVVLSIRFVISYRKLQVSRSKSKLAELQLIAIHSQIDPHFTFNLLSAFKNLLNEQDHQRAEYIFDEYSGLLKTTVLNGDKLEVSLKEELEFVESYASLEAFRHEERFCYECIVSKGIDTSIHIPKMLIHIFVENAIKHGLRHKPGNEGELLIEVLGKNGLVEVTVSDNGIGREAAAKIQRFSTGRGMALVEDMLNVYRNIYKRRIQTKIVDLYSEHKPAGTKVVIQVPK